MLGRTFLVVGALFVGLLAYAFYRDANHQYIPIQQKYAAQYGADFPVGQVQQLFPQVQVNGNFQIERCITCHVPDIQKIGAQIAARRLGPNHPAVIDDAIFARYGEDTLICRPPSASASATAATSATKSAKGKTSASKSGVPSAPAKPATTGLSGGSNTPVPSSITCQNPNDTPFYVLDANGQVVTDPSTGKPMVAQLTGFIPREFKGLGIDASGCVICHNGNRQATTEAGAHQNLVANPFNVYDTAPTLYENTCAQCHGATGEGLKGPPLNDQDRLGFFNDDYYQRCIYYGNLGSEHLGSIMPPWGIKKLLPQPIQKNINLLVNWIRMWQQYTSLP
jgi:mono/diheme cytochrome c family protein